MAETFTQTSAVPARHDSVANEVMFLLSFAFVLCLAVVAQLLFFKWRAWFPGAERETSLLKSVRAGVCTFLSHVT